MKKLLILSLCAILSACADARTLYVNAKAKNNNGSGLSAKKAKKTIQAAVNIAKKGDTILVYPGSYAPIKTKNLKISIKSVKGAAKTEIVKPKKATTTSWDGLALAQLGKATAKSSPVTTGRKTTLHGFLINAKNRDNEGVVGLSGGTAKFCLIENIGYDDTKIYNSAWVAVNGALSDCIIKKNALFYRPIFSNCTVSRCEVSGNSGKSASFADNSILSNTLIVNNSIHSDAASGFASCKLYNCTVADNLFQGYRPSDIPVAEKSGFYNCILWNNWYRYDDLFNHDDSRCDAETAKKFKNAYKKCYTAKADPGFVYAVDLDYRLAKGSPCINKGTLSAAQKKIVGTKDLSGNKRIKGKAVDLGCYEY